MRFYVEAFEPKIILDVELFRCEVLNITLLDFEGLIFIYSV
jgi:hypothetical protein